MRTVTIWAFALLAGWTIVRFYQRLTRKRNRASQARALGCLSPPTLHRPWWDIIGIVNVREALKATKEARMLERLTHLYADTSRRAGYNVRTWGTYGMGKNLISTKDPENIKAILATQFTDFEISDVRIRWMGALLGEGIVSRAKPPPSHRVILMLLVSLSPMAPHGHITEPFCGPALLETRSMTLQHTRSRSVSS